LGLIGNVNIRVEVKNGIETKITGGKAARKLNVIRDKVGKKARNIAEFGIGTNDSARLSGILLEDEKVMGTVHLALGNNVTMGGSVNVPIHIDGVIKKPTVFIDGKLLMEDGKLLI
jgi:leucyl aminopeptidase (aminopeptidase T)